jgi:hypothetical protein
MILSLREDDQSVAETAQALTQRYGAGAASVAREWADIKYRQGAPQIAAIWLRIAARIEQAADA